VDADTGQIAAAVLTTSDVDDASQVGPLLDQVDGPVASFTADGAYDQDGVYSQVAARYPKASVIVPPRSSAVPSGTAETAPTMRDRHLQTISECGRMAWQKASADLVAWNCRGIGWGRMMLGVLPSVPGVGPCRSKPMLSVALHEIGSVAICVLASCCDGQHASTK
jgi:hypothetical protein